MSHDRITAIRVRGLRSLADVELDLSSLTVLVGPNGAGKSSIVEACELLRKAGSEPDFMEKVASAHGGAFALARWRADKIELAVEIDGPAGRLRYELELLHRAPYLELHRERLDRYADGKLIPLMIRDGDRFWIYRRSGEDRGRIIAAGTSENPSRVDGIRQLPAHELALSARVEATDGAPGADLERMSRALAAIEVHTAVAVRPPWVSPGELGARSANVVQGARRLAPSGSNLTNVLLQLKNQRDFGRSLEDIRLGLGDDIEDLVVRPTTSGGQIVVEVRLRGGRELPLFSLSDGQVAYLAQVAIAHMERPSPPSLVVIDEPDTHFHPKLTVRLAQMIEGATENFPVRVATQSDAFLDALAEPAAAAVLCELGPDRETRLLRPDPDTLKAWLIDYDGLGALRRSGFDQLVFHDVVRPATDGS